MASDSHSHSLLLRCPDAFAHGALAIAGSLRPLRCNRDELLRLVRSKENAGGAHSAQTRPRPASLLISLFANARSAPSEPMFGRKSSPSVLKERHQKHGSYLRP